MQEIKWEMWEMMEMLVFCTHKKIWNVVHETYTTIQRFGVSVSSF